MSTPEQQKSYHYQNNDDHVSAMNIVQLGQMKQKRY